jgi:hypothetical protein
MRLKTLRVRGFRGFNDERQIGFHDNLTLVSAPNSHGKTSLTEALEFLLFGETSKVASAISKEEYKDSYRNRHLAPAERAWIEAEVEIQNSVVLLRCEIDGRGRVTRYLQGRGVEGWPFLVGAANHSKPFVVQHALKELLLVTPLERFQNFAKLLGLDDVDRYQKALISLCTKPDASVSRRVRASLDARARLLEDMGNFKPLKKASALLKKGPTGISAAYAIIESRSRMLVGDDSVDVLVGVRQRRSLAVQRVFSGSIAIATLGTADEKRFEREKSAVANHCASATLLKIAAELSFEHAHTRLQAEATLLGLGIQLLPDSAGTCPFCGQDISDDLIGHVQKRHSAVRAQLAQGRGDLPSNQIKGEFASIREAITFLNQVTARLSGDIFNAATPDNLEKIGAILGSDTHPALTAVREAAAELRVALVRLKELTDAGLSTLVTCEEAIEARVLSVSHVETLLGQLQVFLRAVDVSINLTNSWGIKLDTHAETLSQRLDSMAGATELALLERLLAKRPEIERAIRAFEVLEDLKTLKRNVEQVVGELMETTFDDELTETVMRLYRQIQTVGDPDVHFDRFAMDRTKGGDYRARRVSIDATSYGVRLASAVSSLSESKLNALGLCISLATAINNPGPFNFVVLDDPIQSWDEEHEIQFIRVVRSLVESERKQVVLLSHRESWVDQLAVGCQSLRGFRYRISGYTKNGPSLIELKWMGQEDRLYGLLAVGNKPTATPVELQQAEADVRTLACELAAEASAKILRKLRAASTMNGRDVRRTLIQAGCPDSIIDAIVSSFRTTDDAHHSPKSYYPSAQRIRQYHGSLLELSSWIQRSKAN